MDVKQQQASLPDTVVPRVSVPCGPSGFSSCPPKPKKQVELKVSGSTAPLSLTTTASTRATSPLGIKGYGAESCLSLFVRGMVTTMMDDGLEAVSLMLCMRRSVVQGLGGQ